MDRRGHRVAEDAAAVVVETKGFINEIRKQFASLKNFCVHNSDRESLRSFIVDFFILHYLLLFGSYLPCVET